MKRSATLLLLALIVAACAPVPSPTPSVATLVQARPPSPTAAPTLPPTLTPEILSVPVTPTAVQVVSFPLSTEDVEAIAAARSDLLSNRRGDVTVHLQDETGRPLAGYSIRYRQTSHQFEFMTADDPPSNIEYLRELGINGMHLNIWWTMVEPEDGLFRMDFPLGYRNLEELHQGGLTLKAQDVFSMANVDPEGIDTPAYMRTLSFESIEQRVSRHMGELVRSLAPFVDRWEAILEPDLTHHNPFHLDKIRYLELMSASADTIRAHDPEAQIEINFAEPCQPRMKAMLTDILEAGIDFDVVGLQYYYNAFTIPEMGYRPPRLSLAEISSCLDEYQDIVAPYNKRLAVSEVAVPAAAWGGYPGYAGQPWSEDLQAQYLTGIYTIMFSKRLNMSIAYWGSSDPKAFIYESGLVDSDRRPRKAYWALKELLQSWLTEGEGITDGDGNLTIHGFGGEYLVTITDPSTGSWMTTMVEVREQAQQDASIVFLPNADLLAMRDQLQDLVSHWETAGHRGLTQQGKDCLALADYHLGRGELAAAEQVLEVGLEALAITRNIRISPRWMSGYLLMRVYTHKSLWLEGDEVLLWPSDTAYFRYDFPPGRAKASVSVYGSQVDGKFPTIVIGIGDHYSEPIVVTGRLETYVLGAELDGTEGMVTVRFLYEDSSNPGEWKVRINGIDLEVRTSDPSVTTQGEGAAAP